jgi:hypothetical protein
MARKDKIKNFDTQNRVLDEVFHGKLKTALGIAALRDAGVEAKEARRLVFEAMRNGKAQRKAAKQEASNG